MREVSDEDLKILKRISIFQIAPYQINLTVSGLNQKILTPCLSSDRQQVQTFHSTQSSKMWVR